MATTPGNSTNTDTVGSVNFSGTSFSASALTQYDVLVGGASNAISSIGPGSAGQILQSAGNAANPAYSTATYPSTAGSSGNILTSDGTNFVSTTPATGTIVGYASTSTTTATSTSTNIASTGVTPTTGNTTSFLTLNYTAASTGNILKFEFSCPYVYGVNTSGAFFLFSGSTLIGSFPFQGQSNITIAGTGNFTAYANPLSTSLITYSVHYAGTSGSIFLLENTSSTALYNGGVAAYFQITEVT